MSKTNTTGTGEQLVDRHETADEYAESVENHVKILRRDMGPKKKKKKKKRLGGLVELKIQRGLKEGRHDERSSTLSVTVHATNRTDDEK